MNMQKIGLPSPTSELSQSLDKRRVLNISNRASKFHNNDIWYFPAFVDSNLSDSLNPVMIRIGQMG